MRIHAKQACTATASHDQTHYRHKELWVIPSTYIHPESPASQLGLTPKELKPILEHQWEFLQDELAQPPHTLTRPTTTHHHMVQVKPQPNPTPLSPQQEAAQLGMTPQELANISKQAIRKQAKWLAKDETKWRECKEKRWQGKVREDRETREWES